MFDKAFEIVIGHEGEYANNPQDLGGETKYGISKRAYPNENIQALTLDRAKQIYYDDYWLASKANKLPADISIIYFDTAVNCGIRIAMKLLQQAVNATGYNIAVDGIIGPITIEAVYGVDMGRLLDKFVIERARYYTDIAYKNERMRRFIVGWLRRVLSFVGEVNNGSI